MSLNTTFAAGDVLTSAHMNGLQAAWDSYTPSWTASAGAPAVNNGTLVGKYLRIGKAIDFRIELTFGASTTSGTAGAAWRFTLPVTPASSQRHRYLGSAYDNGTADYAVFFRWISGDSYLEVVTDATTAGNPDRLVTNTVPFTWGVGDVLMVQGRYEAA